MMTDYLVLAQFGEGIRTMIPIDAFSSDGLSRDYMADNYDKYQTSYPNAVRFVLYQANYETFG